MEIIFEDAVITPVSEDSLLYDLRFYKRVKKRDTGQYEKELGSPLYGLTLTTVIRKIATYRTSQKYKESTVELKEYLKALLKEQKDIMNYLKDESPEKFDTGE